MFPPARVVSSLISTNLATGFAVANIALVALGVWCYAARVGPGHPSAPFWSWFWTLLEGANGTGHIILALAQGAYFPGAWTAPFLLALSLSLGATLVRESSVSVRRSPP